MARSAWRALQLLLACVLLASAACAVSADSLSLEEGSNGFAALELDPSLGSLAASLDRSMTDRQLFEEQQQATGLPQPEPEPVQAGLNLISEVPCSVYTGQWTALEHLKVILNPNVAEVLAQLGDVVLNLNIVYGKISFFPSSQDVLAAVTWNGDAVQATSTQLTGSLSNINAVLASLWFKPATAFYGYAEINWSLSNTGAADVPQTNGTITVVVGSLALAPSLTPLNEDGVLAGFEMEENTVSPAFEGVVINDPSYNPQVQYEITITSFEGTLNLAQKTGLTYSVNTPTKQVFTGVGDSINPALASFTFASSAWGPYQGNAGFVIVVVNTFYRTSGFIQASIRNIATHKTPIAGALGACRVDQITSTSARVTWDATPAAFQASSATPAPTGYVMQISSESATGAWTTGYEGAATTSTLTGLSRGTVYYCQVAATNGAGASPFSAAVPFTTLPNVPGAVSGASITAATAASVSLSWTAPADNGGGAISSYRVTSQPTSAVGTAEGLSTTVAFTTAVTVSGLKGSTAYTFSIVATNAAGAGDAAVITGATLGKGPSIVSYVAEGPASGANVYSADVDFIIGFDMATNTPAVDSTDAIRALFTFVNGEIGRTFTGTWTDAKTLRINVVETGSALPVIGSSTVVIKGTILAAGGNSAPGTGSSPALDGSFGAAGTLPGQVLIGKNHPDCAQGVRVNLGLDMQVGAVFADSELELQCAVINPRVPDSFLIGEGYTPSQGLSIVATGASSVVQAAIRTLAYQPAPSFSGLVSISIKLKNRITGEQLSSLVTSLNIRAAAALPTVTAPDSVDVILEQFTAVPGVSIGYTDASAVSSATFAVTVSTTHTGQAVFGTAAPGVQFTPIVGTNSVSYQLVGSLSALNAALAKLQVKFTFSSNSAQANFAPDPYTVLVEVSDMVGGNATRAVNANINCNTATVTAPKVVSARLDDSLNSITAQLDLPVSDAFLASPVFECSSLLDSASVGLLGATPVCRWISTQAFKLDLGMGATFTPVAHSLNIKAGALQRCVGGSNPSPAQTVAVAGPLNPKAPAVFISGPKVTSQCNPLLLQAIVSMVGGRTPTLTWTLPRNLNPSFLPSDVSGRILQVDPRAFGESGNFTFTLVATNFLGQASVLMSKTVLATALPVPLIFPTGVTSITQTADRAVRIYNSVTLNPCFSQLGLQPMSFQWSITPALQDGAAVALTSPNLVLSPNMLLPNQTYTATLRVSMQSNPDALFSEIDYTINVVQSALTAYIAGGEWRKVRADAADWTVDGSRCVDPDAISVGKLGLSRAAAGASGELAEASAFAADQYTYAWTCATATGDKCFSSLTGAALQLAASPVITLQQGALKIGVYTFTLTYTHTASKRSATASTLIQVRPGTNPVQYGAKGTVDVLLDVFEVVISPQQKLHLVSSLPTYYSDSTTDLVYTWEVLGGGASGITTATLANNPNVQGFNSSTLVLNTQELEGFFVPGTDYHFKVTAVHRDDPQAVADAGQALVYVRVNALPTCDSFTASPNVASESAGTAVAFNSTVTVSALNCYDSDSDELLDYTFFRVDEQGNRFNLLPVSHSPLGRVPLLPTGSASNKDLLTVGVVVSDRLGGRVEYTKEVKVVANELLRAASGKAAIDEVAALQGLYTNGWQKDAAITGDTQSLLVTQAAILTELNEVAALRASNPFTGVEANALLAFKKSLLVDLGKDAATLPSIQILQALVELVEDAANTDKQLLASTVDFVATRAPQEGGAGQDSELLDTYVRVLKQGLDQVVAATGAVTSGASRRLFSMHEALELGVAEGTPTAADNAAIISSVLATLNLLAKDISSYSLVTARESYLVTLDNAQGLTGAVGRAAQGAGTNVSTLDGFGVLVSPTAFSNLAPGSFVDFGVWGLTPVPFLGMIAAADAATIVSGGASVAAFLPTKLQQSTAVTSFSNGDVEVVVPLNLDLAGCVQGDYTQTTSDGAASGNVYGNMCRIGCKVWNGQTFSDAGATMIALHPLSKRVVCGLAAPGVAVAYNTRLSAPYVIPADENVATPDASGPTEQENGLPFGVVRASLLLQPAPVVSDLNSFKAQIATDLSAIVGVSTARAVVRAVSTNGDASTVIWDFLPANDADSTDSQAYYNSLIKKEQKDFDPQPVLQYTQLATISQLCQDGVYRHECSTSSRAAWELPVIIAACCLVFLCILACCVYACIRLRRARASGGDSLKMAPPMMGTDLVPAKKFVYTAPNSESNANEDKPSEITVMAKGLEFEPSALSGSGGNGLGDANEASKNRLAAKFPNKAAAAAAGAAAGAEEAKEDSQKSSHHFYYVDESVKAAPTPSGASRRESGVAFSLNGGGARNELSGSNMSRSGNSQSQPGTPASDQRKRRGSAPGVNPDEAALDKAALPVVRPGGK